MNVYLEDWIGIFSAAAIASAKNLEFGLVKIGDPMNDNRFELLLFCPTDSIREAMEQSNPWTNKQTNFFVHHLSYQKISDLKRLFEILDRYLAKNFEFGLVKIGDPMNDNRFELLLFWPPLTHISLLLPGFCSTLWCEFLFVYKLYGPLAFSIHFHSLNLKLLVKLILSRHAKKKGSQATTAYYSNCDTELRRVFYSWRWKFCQKVSTKVQSRQFFMYRPVYIYY